MTLSGYLVCGPTIRPQVSLARRSNRVLALMNLLLAEVAMLRRALVATLLASAITPVQSAKEKILLHRIGPSDSTLFIAKTDGSDERPLLPKSCFDYNASFSADGKWIIFTSERSGSADI